MRDQALHLLTDAAWKGVAVLAVAALATLALRRGSAARRHWIWTTAFAGVLFVPLLGPALPAWRRSLVPPDAPSPAAAAPALPWAHRTLSASASSEPGARTFGPPDLAPAAARAARDLGPFWLGVWVLGLAVMLSRLGLALLSARRLLGGAQRITSPEWRSSLSDAAARIGCRTEVALLESAAVRSPIVIGFLRPAIVLPVDARTWPEAPRQAVLLHELAHVRRRDCLVQAVAEAACALHWFNPLAWLGAARLRLERERATDDLVLRAGARPSEYAGHLLEVARRMLPAERAPISAVAVAEPSDLGTRIILILDRKRDRSPLRGAFVALVSIAALGVCTPLGLLTTAPAAAQVAQPQAPPVPGGPVQLLAADGQDMIDLESPERYDGAWWALCPRGGETRLEPARIRVRAPLEVERGLEITMADCAGVVGFIRGLPGLAARALPTATIAQAGDDPSQQATARLGDEELLLRLAPQDNVTADAEHHELVVQSASRVDRFPDHGKEGTLTVAAWRLVWAGDLDEDGRMDVLVQEDDGAGEMGRLRLFLSKGAPAGHLLRKAAFTAWGGC